ncbi:MAG: Fe-S cluster assembly protein SufD [Candidatus Neomarinimicrobiota bacterium]
MTAIATITDFYRTSFDHLEQEASKNLPEAVRQLRQTAMDRFEELGFPTTRMEEWRNTSVEPITRTRFHLAGDGSSVDLPIIEPFRLENSLQVVAADGRFRPELLRLEGLPPQVEVRGLAEVLANYPESVLPHLGQYADFQRQAFVALNTAFLSDGIFIRVPPGTVLERPIHVIHFTAPDGRPTRTHPRTLVLAGENCQLTVLEHYAGHPGRPAFTNAVTEIVAGARSVIDYVRVQQEPDDASHVGTVHTHQEADSRVALHAVTLSGGLVRNDVNAVLKGEGAEIAMNGLYLVKGHQHVDNHTRIDHVAPHCTSIENYKGILDGQGRAVFNGRIVVHPHAQKTNAAQSNKNLMFSDKALVNTNPQLEIYADDVKCTHGAAVGQIDEEAIFYLLSRGIDRMTAQSLLIHGFTQEIIAMIRIATIRQAVNNLVAGWLANGRVPSEQA